MAHDLHKVPCYMKIQLILVLVVIQNFIYVETRESQCRSTEKHPYSWLATKTPYTYLVRDRSLPDPVIVSNCSAVQLWTIVRHGTRYPSKEAIRFMNTDLKLLRDQIVTASREGRGGLCRRDLQELANWNADLNETQAKHLHAEGEIELMLIGERFASRFPELLQDYVPSQFKFRATNTQRSQLSGRNYAVGLFGKIVGSKVIFEDPILPQDPVIRSYKLCHKWKAEVKKHPRSMQQRHKFEESEVMKLLALNVTKMLGQTQQVTMQQLDWMYVTCNFDQAWHPLKLSPWCSVFSTEQLKLMEYREDLEYYWVDGPAYSITRDQSCPLLHDLYINFNRVIQGEEPYNGVFYFSHSGTVLKLLALLGLYEDKQPLLSDNYEDMINERDWKTSFIGPFASNVAFALQKCGEKESDFKVGVFVNEKLTSLPNCELWCPWETFINLYPSLKVCQFDKICDNEHDGERESVMVTDDKY